MSEPISTPTRPVSVITVLFVLVLFALFFVVVRYLYSPASTPAFVGAPDNLAEDQQWRATRESRQKALQESRATATENLSTYGWVDENAKVVRLPIERAMELTAQQYGAKKQ